MQSRKIKPEPTITEAAEKTGLLIRGLQSRLLEGAGEPVEESADTASDLENQLQAYFAGWPGDPRPSAGSSAGSGVGSLDRIRNRVIEGVAERILRGWQQDGKVHPIEAEVVERLIDGMLDMLMANGNGMAKKARGLPPKAATTQLAGPQMQV